jgi:YidC/Oxa1 family membrane protein insertase
MTDNKNTILAIALSALVLIGWQYFVGGPQEKARQEQLQQQQAKQTAQPGQPVQAPPQGTPGAAPNAVPPQVPGGNAPAPGTSVSRATALAASPRVPIKTDSLEGSISLKGGRIDDIALIKFRETIDPKSPPIFLLSPSGTADPFYAEFGWTGAPGANVKVPTADTTWTQVGSGSLGVGHPVTLSWDNGQGLEFRRTIAVDDKYVFTLKDEVTNKAPYRFIRTA